METGQKDGAEVKQENETGGCNYITSADATAVVKDSEKITSTFTDKQLLLLYVHNLRQHTNNVHNSVQCIPADIWGIHGENRRREVITKLDAILTRVMEIENWLC